MDWTFYKNYLLSAIPSAKLASGGTVINCRCFECGDSQNIKSAHLYISIPQDNEKPSLYYCHKCGAAGVVNHTTLIKWGIFDPEIATSLTNFNKQLSRSSKFKKYFDTSRHQIRHSYTTINDDSEIKLHYMCNRLGYQFSYQELQDLKITLNLIDLLEENNISRLTRDQNIVRELDKYFIGFISLDNAFLNMRRICDEGIVNPSIDKRYINYKIFDKLDTSERFYTIPANINLNDPNRIKLHIAEGPFDILSIYLNLRNKEPGIYTSVSGNNYLNLIMNFLINMQLPNIELHIYPDNDKFGTIERIRKIINQIPDKSIPVFIHRNNHPGEKDFGVSLDRIEEAVIRIR